MLRITSPQLFQPEQTFRTALVIAHPGHELSVHGWMEQSRPLVSVLTTGSSDLGKSDLSQTRQIIENTGASVSSLFGIWSDQELYRCVLEHHEGALIEAVELLSDMLVREEIDIIVGDSAEGVHPIHDLCRIMIDAAIRRVEYRYGHEIANYDFAIAQHPNGCSPLQSVNLIQIPLNEEAWGRKRQATLDYIAMHEEILARYQIYGERAFQIEYLRPVLGDSLRYLLETNSGHLDYERWNGQYGPSFPEIHFQEHVYPLLSLLSEAYPRSIRKAA